MPDEKRLPWEAVLATNTSCPGKASGCQEETLSVSDLSVTSLTWVVHHAHRGLTKASLASSHVPKENSNPTAKHVENVDFIEAPLSTDLRGNRWGLHPAPEVF